MAPRDLRSLSVQPLALSAAGWPTPRLPCGSRPAVQRTSTQQLTCRPPEDLREPVYLCPLPSASRGAGCCQWSWAPHLPVCQHPSSRPEGQRLRSQCSLSASHANRLALTLPPLLTQGPPPISFSQAINLEAEMGLLSILWPLFFYCILCCGSSHPSLPLCVCFFKCEATRSLVLFCVSFWWRKGGPSCG
uniref:Uncharacterized protein n=1 Tax=Ursus americanus TaxID=9643 RepID=A0A452QCB2_URSAM